jgi:hypothetical protein
MKSERKNSKLEIKVFFKVLKFLSLFSSISMVFSNFSSSQNIMERDVGSGGSVIQEPDCPKKSLRLSLPESC